MKLLLDNGLPFKAAGILVGLGYDVVHVSEIGMSAASDDAILSYARKSAATISTLDADFHTLLAISGETTPSVVRIRIQGIKELALATIVGQVLARFSSQLASGAVVSVTRHRMSCRSLPLR